MVAMAKKWLPRRRPLCAGYRQCLHSVGRPLNRPPLHNQLPSIYRSLKTS